MTTTLDVVSDARLHAAGEEPLHAAGEERLHAATEERLHGLDAVRASALLLGVVLHAAVAFVPEIPLRDWPVADARPSAGAALLIFVIHVFRMSVFFLIAGFFARLLLERRGLREFLRNRAMRIGLPLVVFWPVCLVALNVVVVWALARTNGGRLPAEMPAELRDAGLSFLHLWFLYILLWLYGLALLARLALRRLDPRGRLGSAVRAAFARLVSTRGGAVLLALPVAAALACVRDWKWVEGVPTPAYTLLPPLPSLFIYAYLFAWGWMLERERALLATLRTRIASGIWIGLAAALASLVTAGRVEPGGVVPGPGLGAIYAVAYATALSAWTLAFVGAGLRFASADRAWVRYLSDASYWIYIAHLPVVIALQTAWMFADVHWIAKLVAIIASAGVLLLASYRFCVRSTWIGLLLNGGRLPQTAPARAES